MVNKTSSPEVKNLFNKLATIEDLHKGRLLEEYKRITGKDDTDDFESIIEKELLEGGMSTEEYMEQFQPNLENPQEVIGLAMSIEAQALDLYTRASRNSKDPEGRKMLEQIASEEKVHLAQLGNLMDNIVEKKNG